MTDLKISQLVNEPALSATDMVPMETVSGYTRKVTGAVVGAYAKSLVDAVKGAANGYAGLDATSKVPYTQLPYHTAVDLSTLGAASERRLTKRVIHLQSGATFDLTTGSPPTGEVLAFFNDSPAVSAAAVLNPGLTGQIDDRQVGNILHVLGQEYVELIHRGSGLWTIVRQHISPQKWTPIFEGQLTAFTVQPVYAQNQSRWWREGKFLVLEGQFVVRASAKGVMPGAANRYFIRLPPIAGMLPVDTAWMPFPTDVFTTSTGPFIGTTCSQHINQSTFDPIWLNLCRNSATTYYGVCGVGRLNGTTDGRTWGNYSSGYNICFAGSSRTGVNDYLVTWFTGKIAMAEW